MEAAEEVSQSIRADFFCSCSLKRLCGTRGARPGWAEFGFSPKVEKILKGSLNLFSSPSPSLEIQIMGGKVWLRGEYKIIA